MSFANIVKAINVVQTEMGITGTTALEAGRTISGSVGAMKAAWTNLVTGFADGNADIEGLINNLVTTIVGDGTENNLGVIGNVLPAIETALGGVAKLIEGAAPKIIEILPGLVDRVVPSVISAATGMVDAVTKVLPDLLNTVVDAIIANAPMLLDSAFVLVGELVSGVLNQLPQIVQLGLDLIVSLANGIAESLPELIPTIMDVILQIVDTLTDPENLSNLLQAALSIITQLAWGLVNALPDLIDAVFVLIENITTFLMDPANLAMLVQAAIELVIALGLGLIEAIPKLITSLGKLVVNIVDYFKNYDWGQLGKNLVDGFKKGIQNAWTNLKKWFKNLFGDLIGIAKKILGIASPSKVFKKIGGFTAEGFGAGFEDEFAHVKDDMEDALNFDDASVGINASIRKVGAGAAGGAFGGTSIGNININIDGAKYSDEQSLASAIALEIQNMTDRRAAVYA
jgi:phage-related protein